MTPSFFADFVELGNGHFLQVCDVQISAFDSLIFGVSGLVFVLLVLLGFGKVWRRDRRMSLAIASAVGDWRFYDRRLLSNRRRLNDYYRSLRRLGLCYRGLSLL